jgi:hypothetical protein
MTMGQDNASQWAAETRSEGARLEQRSLHISSGDSAKSLQDDTRRDFVKISIGIMLLALFVWFIFLIIMLP